MRFLCLGYGDEKGWEALPKPEQDALLARDAVLRSRGDLVMAVKGDATTVRVVDGTVSAEPGAFARARVPFVGFALVEARDAAEAIALVSGSPCPNAGGAVEVWPLREPEP